MPDPIVIVKNLSKTFHLKTGFFGKGEPIRAVDQISFDISQGEILGLVGESGSGKTTTGRIILALEKPDSGNVSFREKEIFDMNKSELSKFRTEVQMIFQDPFSSLPPYMRIDSIIAEPLRVNHSHLSSEELRRLVDECLSLVSLVPAEDYRYKHPSDLSGGQRQRVAIARALILSPSFIVADEAVSMLDASVRVGILNLLLDLRNKRGLSILFITHDLGVAGYTCDRIAVMRHGKIVEIGPTAQILSFPSQDYTKQLLSAVPVLSALTT